MIYYAEDDISIRELVIYTLKNTGFEAKGFEDGNTLLKAVLQNRPKLILLDIMLPGKDGIEILKELKNNNETKDIPVIMLTAKSMEYEKVKGLDLGADDYITKPFGLMELTSRIKAILRRVGNDKISNIYEAGSVVLNVESHTVRVNGKIKELTRKEFELLKLLMTSKGRVLSRDIILENVWGYDFDGETRTVDVHVRTLRNKLGEGGEIIETIRGVGYRIAVNTL